MWCAPMNNRRLPALILLLAGLLLAQTAVAQDKANAQQIRLSTWDKEYVREVGAHAMFLKLLDQPGAMSERSLQNMDGAVHNIAFYRTSDRQNKRFPRTFYASLQQKMMNKFSRVRRFAVHECMECSNVRVVVKKDQFKVLRQAESNHELAEIGKKLDIDHFAMWDAYLDNGEAVINIRVVGAEDGRVRWSQQYRTGGPDRDIGLEFYTSFWGVKATRQATGSQADISVAPLLAVGLRTVTRSTMSGRFFYGYGAEVFLNTFDRNSVNVFGADINGRLAMELDPIFGGGGKNYGNWLLYVSVGQAFIGTQPSVLSRFGLEIRPNKFSFVDLGLTHMLPRQFEAVTLSGYETKAEVGGYGYDITLGVRF